MKDYSSRLAAMLYRCQAGITALLRQAPSREDRAAGHADLLLELFPEARLTACLLSGESSGALAVRPAKGLSQPGQRDCLRTQILSLGPLASGVQTLPDAGPLIGMRALAAAIHEDGRHRGFLLIALASDAPVEDVARVEVLLTVCAHTLAQRWIRETVRAEQAELARFALIGQAFLGLAHELNNALNSMMLQTSVVQLRVDEPTRNELAAIRQHGAQAAGLVRALQQVVQERHEKSYAVDLNAVVADLLEEEPDLRQRVSVQLAADAPLIHSTRSAVKQLVRLILEGICSGTKSAVRVRTEKREDGAALSVEIAETAAERGEEGGLSPADAVLWQNLDEVGRQAGQSLLRQLGGALMVEQRPEGGVEVRVTWGS